MSRVSMQDNYYVRDLIQRIEGKPANGAYRSVTLLLIFWHPRVYWLHSS